MNLTKMAVAGALAIATGISAASMAIGYPGQQLPLLMLQFPNIFTTIESCDGVCESPANDHPGEPPSVNADAVAFGPVR